MKNLPRLFLAVTAGLALFASPQAARAATVGAPAPDFSLTDIAGNVQHLAAYRGKIVVLEWTNPGCPFVRKHYLSGNIPALQRSAAADGIVWLTINSAHLGGEGDVGPDVITAWFKKTGAAPAAYLRDQAGTVGHLFGAKTTPDLFIISADGTLVYSGAIDSIRSVDQADIARATNYVRAALDSLKAGKPILKPISQPYGCSVKY